MDNEKAVGQNKSADDRGYLSSCIDLFEQPEEFSEAASAFGGFGVNPGPTQADSELEESKACSRAANSELSSVLGGATIRN